jgi:hypothetical protein
MQTTYFLMLYFISEVFPNTSNGSVAPCILFVKKERILLYVPYFPVGNVRVIYTKKVTIRKTWTCAVYIGIFSGR